MSGLTLAAVLASSSLLATGEPFPTRSADLFKPTQVWTFHLKFTPEQWKAMEPTGAPAGGPFGGGGFKFGIFLAPAFVQQSDKDGDENISQAEFRGLAETWFAAWDKKKTATLKQAEVRDGLNAVFAPKPDEPAVGFNLQGPKGKRNGVASVFGIEFPTARASMEFEGRTFPDVAVRFKGNGTFLESGKALKKSLKIDLNKFAKGRNLANVTTLNLHSNVTDAASMNEPLAHRLYRDAGIPAPRTSYARVYLTVPGLHDRKLVGLYSLVENVDRHFLADRMDGPLGALFKPVSPNMFAYSGDDWSRYEQAFDPKTPTNAAQKQRVIDFCRLVTKADDAEFAAKIGDYVDLEAAARYFAVTTWLVDLDGLYGPGQNFYLYLHPKTNRFLLIPWDQDHSFGQFGMKGTQEDREGLSIHKPWEDRRRFLERLFGVKAFKDQYLARLDEFSKTIFRPERFDEQVAEAAATIRQAVLEEDKAKAAVLEAAAKGEIRKTGLFGMGGSVTPIRTFAKARTKSVTEQLAGTSKGRELKPPGPPPKGFGMGDFLAGPFLKGLDADGDKSVTRDEFTSGFARWFAAWDADKSGVLSAEELRVGMDRDLSPSPPSPPAATQKAK